MALARGPRDLICSARECEQAATQALVWSNPAIHTGRTKTWLSCPHHVDFLRDYLAYRRFPVEIVPLEEYLRAQASQRGREKGRKNT